MLLYSVAERWNEPVEKVWKNSTATIRKTVIIVALIILCYGLSGFGILNIVKYGFTIVSMGVCPILLVPLIFVVPRMIARDKADGKLDEQGVYDKSRFSDY